MSRHQHVANSGSGDSGERGAARGAWRGRHGSPLSRSTPRSTEARLHTRGEATFWRGRRRAPASAPTVPLFNSLCMDDRDIVAESVVRASLVEIGVLMASLFLPPFQGRLVRRLPSPADLVDRGSCCLGCRDLEILAAVGLHGLLTASLIGLAFFAPAAGASRRPTSRAFGRLRQLWLWGYLDRYDLPAPRGMLGRVPCLYALGAAGLPHAGRRLDGLCAPVSHRPEQLDPRFVQHELTAAAVWAHLQAQVGAGRLVACRWTPERVLRARATRVQDPATGHWLPVLFDGYSELEQRDGTVRRLMVEIDRGTLTIERFRRKLRAWELSLGGEQTARQWGGDGCALLVLTETWERLRGLYRAGRLEVPARHWARYLLATVDVLSPDRFARAGQWLTLDGDYVGVLTGENDGGAPGTVGNGNGGERQRRT